MKTGLAQPDVDLPIFKDLTSLYIFLGGGGKLGNGEGWPVDIIQQDDSCRS